MQADAFNAPDHTAPSSDAECGPAAFPDEVEADKDQEPIDRAIEASRVDMADQPNAEDRRGDGDRGERRRDDEILAAELAEQKIRADLHQIEHREEPGGRAGQKLAVEALGQRINLVGWAAGMADERGEAGDETPEDNRD